MLDSNPIIPKNKDDENSEINDTKSFIPQCSSFAILERTMRVCTILSKSRASRKYTRRFCFHLLSQRIWVKENTKLLDYIFKFIVLRLKFLVKTMLNPVSEWDQVKDVCLSCMLSYVYLACDSKVRNAFQILSTSFLAKIFFRDANHVDELLL